MLKKIKLEGIEYTLDTSNKEAQALIKRLDFSNKKLSELNNILVILRRAKYSYLDDIKREVLATKAGFL